MSLYEQIKNYNDYYSIDIDTRITQKQNEILCKMNNILNKKSFSANRESLNVIKDTQDNFFIWIFDKENNFLMPAALINYSDGMKQFINFCYDINTFKKSQGKTKEYYFYYIDVCAEKITQLKKDRNYQELKNYIYKNMNKGYL